MWNKDLVRKKANKDKLLRDKYQLTILLNCKINNNNSETNITTDIAANQDELWKNMSRVLFL